jgi:hypothetical protein
MPPRDHRRGIGPRRPDLDRRTTGGTRDRGPGPGPEQPAATVTRQRPASSNRTPPSRRRASRLMPPRDQDPRQGQQASGLDRPAPASTRVPQPQFREPVPPVQAACSLDREAKAASDRPRVQQSTRSRLMQSNDSDRNRGPKRQGRGHEDLAPGSMQRPPSLDLRQPAQPVSALFWRRDRPVPNDGQLHPMEIDVHLRPAADARVSSALGTRAAAAVGPHAS